MLTWTIEKIELPLKYTWKISRNASESKTNLLVCVSDGINLGWGEAAPNIRYGEMPGSLFAWFQEHSNLLPAEPVELETFGLALDKLAPAQALRFAMESAYIHYLSRALPSPVHSLLEVAPPTDAFTAYTIPIMEPGDMRKFYDEYRLDRFRFIKLKVGADSAWDAVSALASFCSRPLIIDANEAFLNPEDCIRWLEKIKSFRIEFVEQPMPSAYIEEALYLKKYCPLPLFADESITFNPDFSFLAKAFDGINMKLMKAGGYLNGIRILEEARKRGMKTMIGCMVETTLAISSAMQLNTLADYTDLDSFLLLKDEPFKMVSEIDGILQLETDR